MPDETLALHGGVRRAAVPSDPDELPLSVLHPADGKALRYHVDEFAISWIASLAGAVRQTAEFAAACRVFDPDLLQMHVENALYRDLLDMCRAYLRRAYLAAIGHASAKPVPCPVELQELVRAHWPDPSIALSPRWDPKPLRRRAKRALESGREALTRLRSHAPAAPGGPMVAVELAEGADPARKADAFWLADEAVRAAQVLFVLERRNAAYINVDRELETIRRLGAHAIALHPAVSAGGEIPLWVAPRRPRWLNDYLASMRPGESRLSRWTASVMRDFGVVAWRWEALFRHYEIAVYQQFTEMSLDIAPQRAAIDRVGGIEIGKMRSQFFDRSSAAFHFQHEVALVWHGNVDAVLNHGRTRARAVVPVGYPWGHLFTTLRAEGERLRQQLCATEPRVVLALFDNGVRLNNHLSADALRAFYMCAIDVARRHRNVALIVKTKKQDTLPDMPEVAAELRKLEAEGRCVILSEPLSSVVPAALAADLVLAIPASTAGCEAAAGGCRVLMYEPSGTRDHPLNAVQPPVMFTRFDDFSRALDGFFASQPDDAWPEAAAYGALLDPFRDGRAAERAAKFIEAFLHAKSAGASKSQALDTALNRYKAFVAEAAST